MIAALGILERDQARLFELNFQGANAVRHFMKDSIIYRTDQAWKFRTMPIGIVLSAVIIFGTQWFKNSLPRDWFLGMILFGTITTFLSLAFPFVAIRCRSPVAAGSSRGAS